MTYEEIIERAVQGALRESPITVDRLRVMAEAAFPQINSQVAEAFAAREDKRSLLRKNIPLDFVDGSIGIPAGVLKKYLKDATLVLSTNEKAAFIEPYDDFLRVRDSRLPWWAFNNSVVSAINSASGGGGVYVGPATLTCIASPDIPATFTTAYAGPDDMIPELIEALISFLLGKTEDEAAETA